MRSRASALVNQVGASVTYNRAQSGYPNAHGMAIYLPPRALTPDPAYRDGYGATWSWATECDEFLFAY